MQTLDLILLTWLHDIANSYTSFRYLAIFCASYLQYIIGLVLIVLAIGSQKWIKIAIAGLLSGLIARYGVKSFILLFVDRGRPYITIPYFNPLISQSVDEQYKSFPSGHTIFLFALATTIYLYNKLWGIFFYVSALLIGVARIAVGVHYPTDILAGAILGILTGIISVFLFSRIKL